ncbi:hypothetical protein GCM10025857_22180 [Alicyclobacillus contaminans]|uniref:transcriptional regulator GutM n=1 Tax=Alicyclobacillus contaminans TaxID=392016 RepID=UPI0004212551|nr:transcriptional regulator GutM [Alicyclobacillus contaminans]GMA50861.1 hypothetical protein GCM10025857_22180 [Alicyclobacillus contaminans]
MNTFGIISAVAIAWLLQYALTWLQIRHYRRAMKQLVERYRQREGYYLFSGIARKALGSGAIVLMIVDDTGRIQHVQALVGFTVLAKFSPHAEHEGRTVEEVMQWAETTLQQRRRLSSRRQSLARAFRMAAENALRFLNTRKTDRLPMAE